MLAARELYSLNCSLLAKQIFYFCSCSQKNRSARHAGECSQRPFVTPLYRLTDILDVILLLARGNSGLGEAELRFSKIRERKNLPKERQRRKDRIEISLFIFDELLGATYPSQMFIGKENAYVCIW